MASYDFFKYIFVLFDLILCVLDYL